MFNNIDWASVDIKLVPSELMLEFHKCTILHLNGEVWMDYVEIPERYEVSSYGRVRSKSYVKTSNNSSGMFSFTTKPKIIKTLRNKEGYIQTRLRRSDKKDITRKVHRMVALTFLKDYYKDELQVNHKNSLRFDNRLSNLEWVTQQENIRHGFDNGRSVKGVLHPQALLNEDLVRYIITEHRKGVSLKDLSNEIGINYHTIWKVVKRINWKHVEV